MSTLAISPLPYGGSQARGQKCPKFERIGYITPAVRGVPHKGGKLEVAYM